MNISGSNAAAARARAIAELFDLPVAVDEVAPYGGGLINATFLVGAGRDRYVLQRINEQVFPKPERIMANWAMLEGHLASYADPQLRIPYLVSTRDGRRYARDSEGGTWRLMGHLPNARTLRRIETLHQAREVGRMLGRFHRLVSNLPVSHLEQTLPGFHDAPLYLQRFLRVSDEKGPLARGELGQAIAFVAARRELAGALAVPHREGRIPLRAIHGDPKLDNILFDCGTGCALALIDLDTFQPGLVNYDIADCLRSSCNRSGELGRVGPQFDLEVCRALLAAYSAEAQGLLSGEEIALLPTAIRLVPFELGLRFLTDHLEGDRYFQVSRHGANLAKALVQFALVEDIERKEHAIRDIVTRCLGLRGSSRIIG